MQFGLAPHFEHILLDARAAKQRADESSATLNVPERSVYMLAWLFS